MDNAYDVSYGAFNVANALLTLALLAGCRAYCTFFFENTPAEALHWCDMNMARHVLVSAVRALGKWAPSMRKVLDVPYLFLAAWKILLLVQWFQTVNGESRVLLILSLLL